MLLALWSPKGGSGTSVLAAACVATLARTGPCRLADLAGDQPAILGLGADPGTGIADWLAAGPDAPVEALDRLAVEVAPGLHLVPPGTRRLLAPHAAAAGRRRARGGPAGGARAVRRRRGPGRRTGAPDGGRGRRRVGARRARLLPDAAAGGARAAHRAGDGRRVRRRARSIASGPPRSATSSIGRCWPGSRCRPAIARAVDAGILAVRTPEPLARAAARLLERVRAHERRRAGHAMTVTTEPVGAVASGTEAEIKRRVHLRLLAAAGADTGTDRGRAVAARCCAAPSPICSAPRRRCSRDRRHDALRRRARRRGVGTRTAAAAVRRRRGVGGDDQRHRTACTSSVTAGCSRSRWPSTSTRLAAGRADHRTAGSAPRPLVAHRRRPAARRVAGRTR